MIWVLQWIRNKVHELKIFEATKMWEIPTLQGGQVGSELKEKF